MILVTGAAGKTGKAVVAALAARGARVRVLLRNPAQAPVLTALGAADIALGSFDDPESLRRAAAGVAAIYHICPNVSPHELAYARAVAVAARACGVPRFVYHSVLHPQIEAMPHHWRKLRAEEMLFGSGFALTVLQPTAYMQNLAGAWRGVVVDDVLRAPYPVETRLCLVDLHDVAAVAALVLTEDGHAGATYELVGTEPLSQVDVAAAIGAVLRRDVHAQAQSIEAWDAHARSAGVGDAERSALIAMFRYYAAHGLIGNANTLRWLLGRAPTSLADFIRRFAAEAAAEAAVTASGRG
jgi:NAD(P)H dehydrogenase (quinone)